MTLQENQFWRFLTSVQFALVIIASLATTSIIGTIIPQGEPISFYAERYGVHSTVFFEIIALNNMYYSFWFRGLLVLFCINLIACSINRIPSVLKVINKDNFKVDLTSHNQDTDISLYTSEKDSLHLVNDLKSDLRLKASNIQERDNGSSFLVFFERGAWSRFGAYMVHLSILVIILGGVIGSLFGFKAFVMVPEGDSTSVVYSQGGEGKTIPLDFEVYCDAFDIDYYQNGTPKEYRSDLSVYEQGQEIKTQRITVNDPLSYKGITFYQSSYQQIPGEYTVKLMRQDKIVTGIGLPEIDSKSFSALIGSSTEWDEAEAEFKIIESNKDGHGHGPYKISFDDADNNAITFVTNDNQSYKFERETGTYSFFIKQKFATGLQVAKDPGVWVVYLGCILMLIGLYVSFFMSHKKIWIAVIQKEAGTEVIVRGSTNKNRDSLLRFQKKIESAILGLGMKSVRRV